MGAAGDTVLLREVQYLIRADVEDPIKNAVEASSVEPILAAFPVQAYGKDKRPVIDVTSPVQRRHARVQRARGRSAAAGSIPSGRSSRRSRHFPRNIETRVLVTYRPRARAGRSRAARRFLSAGEPNSERSDRRAAPQHGQAAERADAAPAVRRPRRLLPRHVRGLRRHPSKRSSRSATSPAGGSRRRIPKAPTSEPKQPIVFYIGREVPAKWRPWVKKGIEAWQPAFEKAGFLKAIIGKEPPSEREDPDWDAEDARYSSIRWLPATIENAFGPHVHDPRTGEILEADIRIYHNVMKLIRDWYFVQASPNDKRAQKLPLPDDLMGEILAYVVSHEVGHSLGFPHNMKASSSYTIEQLRDAEFTKKYGVEASIMDYGRFNYVAQPGDNAPADPDHRPLRRVRHRVGLSRIPRREDVRARKSSARPDRRPPEDRPQAALRQPQPGRGPIAADRRPGLRLRAAPPSWASRTSTGLPVSWSRPPPRKGKTTTCFETCIRAAQPAEPGARPRCQRRRWVRPDQLLVSRRQEGLRSRPARQQQKAVKFLIEHAFQTPTA